MPYWDQDLNESPLVQELREQLRVEQDNNLLLLEESMTASLELAAEDAGWQRMTTDAVVEFSDAGIRRIVTLCQLMALKNSLVIRGLALRAAYTWGEGIGIAARATGTDGTGQTAGQDVNSVIQAFLDDEANSEFVDPAGQITLSHQFDTDGQVPIVLWTRPKTGRVRVRTLPFLEITDKICNPDDRSDVWFYRRDHVEDQYNPLTGEHGRGRRTVFHPALGYRPLGRPRTIKTQDGTFPIEWDAPMLMVHGVKPMKWAVPVVYGANDWARGYSWLLDDLAKLVKALSRYAYKVTSPGSKQAGVRAAIAAAPGRDPRTGEPLMSGATAMMRPDQTLEPVPKTGATISADWARPLAAMVGAALGLPVTMLLGDPGVTGARATAETLDRPTELTMLQLRRMWDAAIRRILDHVIDSAVRAPNGPLKGTVTRDDEGREVVTLAEDTDRTIDLTWPPMEDVDVERSVKAIADAMSTGAVPRKVGARLLLEVLGVEDVDSIIAECLDEHGNWIDESLNAGTAALRKFARGEDPAVAMGGEPDVVPDDDPDDEDDDPPPAA